MKKIYVRRSEPSRVGLSLLLPLPLVKFNKDHSMAYTADTLTLTRLRYSYRTHYFLGSPHVRNVSLFYHTACLRFTSSSSNPTMLIKCYRVLKPCYYIEFRRKRLSVASQKLFLPFVRWGIPWEPLYPCKEQPLRTQFEVGVELSLLT